MSFSNRKADKDLGLYNIYYKPEGSYGLCELVNNIWRTK
jgi:hypothetical protein